MESHIYTVHYEYFKDGETEGYNVLVPALPGCITWGRTIDEARAMAADAIACYIEGLRKDGEPIPEDLVCAETVRVGRASVPASRSI